MVEDTIPGVAPDQIAILRLDTDFYTSTHHELEHLLTIDDCGAILSARLAADGTLQNTRLTGFCTASIRTCGLSLNPR